jgi:hypothetical protein
MFGFFPAIALKTHEEGMMKKGIYERKNTNIKKIKFVKN